MSSWSDVVACASDDAAATFLEHGVAVIPNAVDDATVDACRTRAIEDLAACEAAVAQRLEALDPTAPDAHHEAVRCERCDFAELVRRDGGRCDVRDLTPSNGPTEFRLGSHRRSAESPPKRSRRSPVAPTCARGSALLFDYRVDHRGLANRSEADRLVFFMAYARPWFRDAKNTRSKVPLFPATFAPWARLRPDADGRC
ncbi:phytanoyl-CoA dioxygenase [Aureococcus anophagefferens]|nr:phytanoyl-CoA dioxygenase [Aureococcus anophagefferens]